VNPYLMLSAILGAALTGIEQEAEPPAPVTGNAYAMPGLQQLPATWGEAIDIFERSPIIAQLFAPEIVRNYILTKRQELHYMSELTAEERVELYLDTV
jgi:glutamine synthetase